MLKGSLRGLLILDSGKLAGSYFDRTVILICRHDQSGAFGLVLNRPLKRILGTLIRESLGEELAKTVLFAGGPVQPGVLSFLQEGESQMEGDVLPWLTLKQSLEDLKEYYAGEERQRLRVYAGYAGWAPGQLEDEMKEGCWVTHPSSASLVFSLKPETLWRSILHEKGGAYYLVAECPEKPEQN